MQLGDIGLEVQFLQSTLKALGYDVSVDGHFGPKTQSAVILAQRKAGLVGDGIAGPRTMAVLTSPTEDQSKFLKLGDFEAAAAELKCDLPSIRAIYKVESKGRGFLPSGRPIILYERHIFFKRVAAFNHANATKWAAAYPSICNKQYGGYVGGEDEWPRLLEAAKLNSDVAHESASYGLFQIMGFHWKSLGYSSVNDFVSNMGKHEANQLNAFVRFIKTNPVLHAALKKKDWAEVARLYNGADYARNRYDVKLAAAYEASW